MSDEDAELENFLCRVGMVFLPNDDKLAAEARDIIEHVVAKEGRCKVKAWRDVPVDKSVVGRLAKATEPRIVQVCPLHSCLLQLLAYMGCQNCELHMRPTTCCLLGCI